MIRRIAQALVFVLAFLIIVAEVQRAEDAAAARKRPLLRGPAVTYEEMRFTHQCPERLAQRLFADLEESRAEVAHLQSALAAANAMHTMEQALRARAENKLAAATTTAPRRAYRQDEEK